MAKDLGYVERTCLLFKFSCLYQLYKWPIERYHIYVVLIQDIKQMFQQPNVTFSHTRREGNYCTNYMAKLGASSNMELLLHDVPYWSC